MKNSSIKGAIILGRDFLESNQLTLVNKYVKDKGGNGQQKVGLFSEIALSVIEDEPDHSEQELKSRQLVDLKTKKTSRHLESNKSELVGRSIYRKDDRNPQSVVPKSTKTNRLRAHHLEVGHGDLEKTLRETPGKYKCKKPSVYCEGDYVMIRDLRIKRAKLRNLNRSTRGRML